MRSTRTIEAEAIIDRLPILTPRLRLRRLRPGDAPAVADLMNDWDVAKQTGDVPFPYSEAAARDWIGRESVEWRRGLGCALALEDKETEVFVGALSLRVDAHSIISRRGELGYWLGKAYWGQGLATEAVGAALPWFCTLSKTRRIEAMVFAENGASMGVLKKLGFRRIRSATEHYPARGGKRRVNIYQWTLQQENTPWRDWLFAPGWATRAPTPQLPPPPF